MAERVVHTDPDARTKKFARELTLDDVWWRKGELPCYVVSLHWTSTEQREISIAYRDPYTAPEAAPKVDVVEALATVEVN